MIAFVLWLFGVLVISSLIMVAAWGDAARRLLRELGGSPAELIWCKPFVIAAGLTVHASSMALACGYRAFDLLAHDRVDLGSYADFQVAVLLGLATSKVMFVWAGSTDERRRQARWPWWAFLYALILWGLFCLGWAASPDLHPRVREMAARLQLEATTADIPLAVTFTLRSMATQDALYAQGRTKPGKIVTNARAGYSFHNYGLALDVVPLELLRLLNWGDNPHDQARANALWAKLGAIGKAIGFRWGGEFKSRPDRPHFEWSGTLSLADLRAGKRPV